MSLQQPALTSTAHHSPQYLWFLTLSYSMAIVLANWFAPRLVSLFGIITDAGTIIFPLTFLISDLITEVYGYKQTRRAIWCGFLFNVIFIACGQIIVHLPGPDFATNNAAFDKLFATDMRIIFASTISYIIAEPLNSILMAKLKVKFLGRQLGFRFVASTFIASGFDSLLFCSIAFYGSMSNSNLLSLIFGMWFIKIVIEILGLPLSIRLAKKLKRTEELDIFDNETDFTLLSLNADYSHDENKFKRGARRRHLHSSI